MNLYEERSKLFADTAMLHEPDRVPIMSWLETFAVGYAGKTYDDFKGDIDKEIEIYSKVHNDICFDGIKFFGFSMILEMYEPLGASSYFVSSDGVTMQHRELCDMREDEYAAFIEDPLAYIDNVFLTRKYPNLSLPYPQNKEAMKKSLEAVLARNAGKKKVDTHLREVLQMPVCTIGSTNITPADLIFDFLRGFKETLNDMRRRPKLLKQAIDALTPFAINRLPAGPLSSFPFVNFSLHCPTYISPKQFETLYFDAFKEMVMTVHERGGKACLTCEGNWMPFYDFLLEMPKGSLILLLDKDDIFETKKRVGHACTIGGGMSRNMLKYSSKQECLDYAKRLLDECAPGGGYIFSTDGDLLSTNDVQIENLKAVNEYVYNNGRY